MDTYTIEWGPEEQTGTICVHLLNPSKVELAQDWVLNNCSEETAVLVFWDFLPKGACVVHEHVVPEH